MLLPVFLACGMPLAWANGGGADAGGGEKPPAAVRPQIGLAKQAGPAFPNGDGTYTATIELRVQNVGREALQNVQIIDDVQALIAPADVVAIEGLSVSGDLSEVNTHFDGMFTHALLSGDEDLGIDGEALVRFDLVFHPNGEPGPFFNSAKALANGKGSNELTFDWSQNGADPDPDTPGNAPGDNPEPDDDREPTPIELAIAPVSSALGLAKRLAALEE